MKSRIIALWMALLMMIAPIHLFSVSAEEGDWSTDYKSWSQTDSLWGSMKIGTKTMSAVGCLVVAVAKLMVHAGQRDPATFHPGIALEEMKEKNLFRGTNSMYTGLLASDYFSTYAPELTSVFNSGGLDDAWTEKEAAENIQNFISNGYYVIIMSNTVRSTTHWMAVDDVEDGHVMVMDNRGVIDLYASSTYKGVSRYLLVKYSGDKSYPAYDGVSVPEEPGDSDEPCRAEIYTAPDQLRIRSTPSLSGTVLGGLEEGEQITVTEVVEADGYTWGKIQTGGWCAISLCTYQSGALYYVSYDPGKGTGEFPLQENPFGQQISLTDQIPIREGYTFLGWSNTENAVEPTWRSGDSLSVNEDVKLYAVWSPERAERYVAPDLLLVRSEPSLQATKLRKLTEGTVITVTETTVADGYTWGKLIDGGWSAISICSYLDGALNYIFYDPCGGVGGISYQSNPTGQIVTLTDRVPTNAGKRFLGWTEQKGSDEASYTSGDVLNTDTDLYLYAVWGSQCDHSYTDRVVSPTESSGGYTERICTLCGHTEIINRTDSLGKVTVLADRLSVQMIFAGELQSDLEQLSVKIDENSAVVNPYISEIVCQDGYTTVCVVLYGVSLQTEKQVTISVTLGDRTADIIYTPSTSKVGYDSCRIVRYQDSCNVILITDADIAYKSEGYAVSDTGSEYAFTVSYRSGKKVVLECADLPSDVRWLSFPNFEFSVLLDGVTEEATQLQCPKDSYFSPYCQVKVNDSDSALFDLRFVILGNLTQLENVASAEVHIRFYQDRTQVNQISGILGGENSNYRLYTALSAAGEIYAAADGFALFGQQITGIPRSAFDCLQITITDRSSGEVLLDVSHGSLV